MKSAKPKSDDGLYDPVVAEVREIRTKLWHESGETISGLLELLDKNRPFRKPGKSRSTRKRRK